ncbi:proton-associated sugar transporter A-like [Brachionus plicatilis]|uniref:Proton-associated sugar transporter A-like n=1 Tax=Brachionus plicatilis TaxID=10195 RepID=A0A3M7QXE9_BRAPC|nr:proton-associated sugar transporter A-like [Brachionus plicatilis]
MTMSFKIHHLINKINESEPTQRDFDNVCRRKTKLELICISLIVFGIEICYAAETAFVSPILQKIGIPIEYTSMVWGLSPIIGFFACPILGSLSDECHLPLGRRRPFIILYSIGIMIGLILTGYGHVIGNFFSNGSDNINTFVIILTIIGVVLLDFNCDACQSPARAYLIDVSQESDHSVGLSTFTVMAGAGGCIGYVLGGIPWNFLNNQVTEKKMILLENDTWINRTEFVTQGDIAYSHKQILFSMVAVIYVICAFISLTSFKEIPLDSLKVRNNLNLDKSIDIFDEEEEKSPISYDDIISLDRMAIIENKSCGYNNIEMLRDHIKSVLNMPNSLLWLCITHFFCWMSLLCYSLYFTDFVGEEVFGGIPSDKEKNAELNQKYDSGVRIGSFCMGLYSLSCSFYSYFLEKIIYKFNTRKVYTFSPLIYSFGMLLLGISKSKAMIGIASLTAGVMYSCLFTIPFILVAQYHTKESFELLSNEPVQARGLGTDIAIVSSMVFIAQFFLSIFIGFFIKLIGTKTVVVFASSLFSLCASFSAQKILYLD